MIYHRDFPRREHLSKEAEVIEVLAGGRRMPRCDYCGKGFDAGLDEHLTVCRASLAAAPSQGFRQFTSLLPPLALGHPDPHRLCPTLRIPLDL